MILSLELGLGDAVELKTVNLAEGENFRPEFLAKVRVLH